LLCLHEREERRGITDRVMLITRSQFHSKGLDLVVVIVIVIVVLVMVVVMLVTVIVTKGHALETTVM